MKEAEFYFPEGNIVLVVGAGSNGVLFRVFLGQLAKHSTFFCDALVLPQPLKTAENARGKGAEAIDGCPVVRLDDQVDDLRNTFRLLWDIQ